MFDVSPLVDLVETVFVGCGRMAIRDSILSNNADYVTNYQSRMRDNRIEHRDMSREKLPLLKKENGQQS